MHTTTELAAVLGIRGMQLGGAITVTGFAFLSGVCLIAGLRGSDRIKIQNKDQALIWGFITGTLWVAAGGTWADFANGLSDVGKSATTDTGLGNPGPGGSACLLLLLAWAWPWKKRMLWPALLGLMGAVLAGQAGGIPGIFVTLIRSVVAKMAGG